MDTIEERKERFRQRLILTAKGRHGARTMSREEAQEALAFLLSGEAENAQVAAFLTAMRFKGAEMDEMLGFCDAVKEHSISINPKVDNLLDCNGPYDGRAKSLHLGVAAAIVAASAGVPVIMHSSTDLNPKRGVTTAHVLESLGIPAYLAPEEVERRIEKTGFGFLHSSRFSYGIERLRPVRETIFYRTFLHTCEVLNNPAGARLRLVGGAHTHFLQKLVSTAMAQGAEHLLAVHGLEGSDELPLKKIDAVECSLDGGCRTLELDPGEYGISISEGFPAASAEETARAVYESLAGRLNEHTASISYNAGVRIYLGRRADTIADGIRLAAELLESGKALKQYSIISTIHS